MMQKALDSYLLLHLENLTVQEPPQGFLDLSPVTPLPSSMVLFLSCLHHLLLHKT